MNADWEKDYPLLSDLSEKDLDDNSSLQKMLRLIGENKRVIDFGCATGYFSRLLCERGCEVIGVEVNPKAAKVAENYCNQVIIADLDFVSLNEILLEKISSEKFDVAVFGDVLEHLRNPWKVLKETQSLLKPEGYVIASIPNIAHGAIRLALLQGNFQYQPLGILDNTHLRFFTRKTVEQLFEDTGYLIDVIEPTKLPIYSNSNLIPAIEKHNFDKNITQEIEQDEDADTLQFVIRAYPVSLENKYANLSKQYREAVKKLIYYETEFDNLRVELEQSKNQFENKNSEFEQVMTQLQHTEKQLKEEKDYSYETKQELEKVKNKFGDNQVELEKTQIQLKQKQLQLDQHKNQLQQIQKQWEDNQIKLQQAHEGWEHCQQIIQAMETSKFWKLRETWFKLKRYLSLKVN
ncbi:MAG: methyltransferase domain-containing protein [Cyanobacteriota bacterium]|nr:methyltransferase domain-containing protein [Cyanobacteriota bacterium]